MYDDSSKSSSSPGSGRKRAGRAPGGRGRRRQKVEVPDVSANEVAAWFAGRLPDDWFTQPLDVLVDVNEIIVTGVVAMPQNAPDSEPGEAADTASVAATSRIEAFREETRSARIDVAEVGQVKFQRHVTWAVTCGEVSHRFTAAHVPVMTRLAFDERTVLDTLVDSGVARSRSEAMAWCVNQVGEHQSEWIDKLRDAMTEVEKVRNQGPD